LHPLEISDLEACAPVGPARRSARWHEQAEFILRFTFTNPDLETLEHGPLAPDLYDETKRRLGAVESVPRRALQ